jgi:hypothetical protein
LLIDWLNQQATGKDTKLSSEVRSEVRSEVGLLADICFWRLIRRIM